MAIREPVRVRFRGVTPGRPGRGAVLALNGASTADLAQATAILPSRAERTLLVAVDGGLKTIRRARRVPDLYVGDLDSVQSVPPGVEAVELARDKSTSDLGAALQEVARRRARVISVAGLLGGRIDHEWSNLFELGRRAGAFAGILSPTRRGLVVVCAGGGRFETAAGLGFSIFALAGPATVTLGGARWSLSRRRLAPGSQGLSNVSLGAVGLTVHRGSVAVVFPG